MENSIVPKSATARRFGTGTALRKRTCRAPRAGAKGCNLTAELSPSDFVVAILQENHRVKDARTSRRHDGFGRAFLESELTLHRESALKTLQTPMRVCCVSASFATARDGVSY